MKKFLRYVPSIIFAFVEVLIVVTVLDNTNYTGNANIMAALIIIYASIRSFAISIGISMDKLVLGLAKDITDIKERIRHDFNTEEERETLAVGAKKIAKVEIKLIIRAIGVGIIYLIALVHLLG